MNRAVVTSGRLRFCLLFVVALASTCAVRGARANAQTPGTCIGDCNGNRQVTVGELVTGVNISLERAPLSQCHAFDRNEDQQVTVDELTEGVNAALAGCQPPAQTPTPTPTPTPTATSAPFTNPGDLARAVAGRVSVAADAMASISTLVTAIASGLKDGGADGAADTLDCKLGGARTRTCTSPSFNSIIVEIGLSNCAAETPQGSVTFSGVGGSDGMLRYASPGTCSPLLPVPPISTSAQFVATVESNIGGSIATATTDLSATITSLSLGGGCFLTGASLTLNGPVAVESPGGTVVTMTFHNTSVSVDVGEFNNTSDCVPVRYSLTFNGDADFEVTPQGRSFEVTFANLLLTQDATTTPPTVELAGGMNSTCYHGTATVATLTPLLSYFGSPCLIGGRLQASSTAAGAATIIYSGDLSVGIDANQDGTVDTTFRSCLAEELLQCPP